MHVRRGGGEVGRDAERERQARGGGQDGGAQEPWAAGLRGHGREGGRVERKLQVQWCIPQAGEHVRELERGRGGELEQVQADRDAIAVVQLGRLAAAVAVDMGAGGRAAVA